MVCEPRYVGVTGRSRAAELDSPGKAFSVGAWRLCGLGPMGFRPGGGADGEGRLAAGRGGSGGPSADSTLDPLDRRKMGLGRYPSVDTSGGVFLLTAAKPASAVEGLGVVV